MVAKLMSTRSPVDESFLMVSNRRLGGATLGLIASASESLLNEMLKGHRCVGHGV